MSSADLLIVIGRVLLGGYFGWAGVHHFFLVGPINKMVADRGVPAPKAVMLGGSVFQIVCGVALALGLYVAVAAFGLILFSLVATVMLVNFWDMEGPARQSAVTTWQSNIAIVGGLLIAAVGGM